MGSGLSAGQVFSSALLSHPPEESRGHAGSLGDVVLHLQQPEHSSASPGTAVPPAALAAVAE